MNMENKNNTLDLFGKRLRQRRLQLNYTQNKLAKKLGITEEAISQIENGKRLCSLLILYKIMIELDCSADFLIMDLKENNSNNKHKDIVCSLEPEIKALKTVVEVFYNLDNIARIRVLNWLMARFQLKL